MTITRFFKEAAESYASKESINWLQVKQRLKREVHNHDIYKIFQRSSTELR